MAIFRCYFLGDDDHIRAAAVIEAGTPDAAIEKGLALLRRCPYLAMEIWEGATKVFSTATPPAPPLSEGDRISGASA